MTGGKFISEEVGLKLEETKIEDLGRARKVVSTKEYTTIVDGAGNADAIKDRVAAIKGEMEKVDSDFDREKLQERLAKLSGGIAVIKVGAATETEMKEKKQRIEDAVAATKAAVEEGIVPGGGVALIRALKALESFAPTSMEHDEYAGVSIIRRALEEPMRQIAANAGKDGAVIVAEVKKQSGNFGYNAATDTFEDLVKAGIIDPTKVTRALQTPPQSPALAPPPSHCPDIPRKRTCRYAWYHGGMGIWELVRKAPALCRALCRIFCIFYS